MPQRRDARPDQWSDRDLLLDMHGKLVELAKVPERLAVVEAHQGERLLREKVRRERVTRWSKLSAQIAGWIVATGAVASVAVAATQR